MGEHNKPGSESTSGYGPGGKQTGAGQSPGQGQKPMAPPNKSDTNLDPKENGRKNRDQGLEKKKASDADQATNPGIDPDDIDDDRPAKTPDDDDRPRV